MKSWSRKSGFNQRSQIITSCLPVRLVRRSTDGQVPRVASTSTRNRASATTVAAAAVATKSCSSAGRICRASRRVNWTIRSAHVTAVLPVALLSKDTVADVILIRRRTTITSSRRTVLIDRIRTATQPDGAPHRPGPPLHRHGSTRPPKFIQPCNVALAVVATRRRPFPVRLKPLEKDKMASFPVSLHPSFLKKQKCFQGGSARLCVC